MKKFILLFVMLFASISIFSQDLAPADPVDWSNLYLTFATTLAAIPAIVELIKRITGWFVELSSLAVQIVSWGTGLIVVLTGWIFGWGWLDGLTWYEMLAYAVIASLASNGVFDFIGNITAKRE
jgi:hypothetical protein